MSETLETHGRYRLRLVPHEYAYDCNPRTDRDTNLTYVVTVPDRYYDDIDGSGPLSGAWEQIKHRADAMDLFERYVRIFHSGTAERSTPHDGPSAVWYVLPAQMEETGPSVTPEQVLRQEIDEYRTWARGEVYAYIIEKSITWVPKEGQDTSDIEDFDDETTTWETVEDCWGCIGREYAEEAAREAFAPYKEN